MKENRTDINRHFFAGIQEFKKLIHSLGDELQQLIGDTRIMFAMKKNSSLGNMIVRNKKLSLPTSTSDSQCSRLQAMPPSKRKEESGSER